MAKLEVIEDILNSLFKRFKSIDMMIINDLSALDIASLNRKSGQKGQDLFQRIDGIFKHIKYDGNKFEMKYYGRMLYIKKHDEFQYIVLIKSKVS